MALTMLHPVGSRPPAVYWRRRLVLFASLVLVVLLIVLTVRAVTSGGGEPAAAGTPAPSGSAAQGAAHAAPPATKRPPTTSPATTKPGTTKPGTTKPASTGPSSAESPTSTPRTSKPPTSTPPPAPAKCAASQLSVSAAVGKTKYSVGDQPLVMLQVVNDGPKPCVQDLADPQVVLLIYNGASRVWGSHDCKIEPGVTDRTLTVGQPVRVSIVWSGMSSRPECAGTRQRVGAGTYTLYAELSGHRGKAAQFTIS